MWNLEFETSLKQGRGVNILYKLYLSRNGGLGHLINNNTIVMKNVIITNIFAAYSGGIFYAETANSISL